MIWKASKWLVLHPLQPFPMQENLSLPRGRLQFFPLLPPASGLTATPILIPWHPRGHGRFLYNRVNYIERCRTRLPSLTVVVYSRYPLLSVGGVYILYFQEVQALLCCFPQFLNVYDCSSMPTGFAVLQTWIRQICKSRTNPRSLGS